MCSVGGYVGPTLAVPILLDGLEWLAYRGYDSAGVPRARFAGAGRRLIGIPVARRAATSGLTRRFSP
jgi:hypothetical protein